MASAPSACNTTYKLAFPPGDCQFNGQFFSNLVLILGLFYFGLVASLLGFLASSCHRLLFSLSPPLDHTHDLSSPSSSPSSPPLSLSLLSFSLSPLSLPLPLSLCLSCLSACAVHRVKRSCLSTRCPQFFHQVHLLHWTRPLCELCWKRTQ